MLLNDGSTTDDMIYWLRHIARFADPSDAANLRACADRMERLYYGEANDADLDARNEIAKSLAAADARGPVGRGVGDTNRET